MNLRERLKSETAALHDQIEAQVPMKRLMSVNLTEEEYGFALARFWSIYKDLEPSLLEHTELRALLPDLDKRGKLNSLANDLEWLGCTQPVRPSPRADISLGQALGTLYVLEGSTLGAQVISKNLRRHPFIGDHNLNFFNHYGMDTMKYWRTFLAALASADPELDDEIVASAKMTFKRFGAAFAEGPDRLTALDAL